MNKKGYDFIGDIHGQHGKLVQLLERLGYKRVEGVFRHPEGRRAVFLGDLVDRGPDVRGVVRLVRGMVEAGEALAIIGNHELNLIQFHTPDGRGGWLRARNERNLRQCAKTLEAYAGCESELATDLHWMKTLPVVLELEGCRAVHACWDPEKLKLLAGRTLRDEAFLRACGRPHTPEFDAMEILVKGAEIPLPPGVALEDQEGVKRSIMRTRWWGLHEGMTLADLIMPPGSYATADPVLWEHVRRLPCYGPEEPPVFFGHYWMPPHAGKEPLAPNLACLDFGAGRNGPLTAYRWNGEKRLRSEAFVWTDFPGMEA